jgi:hypothetical protein
MVLSRQILVTKQSNSLLITECLYSEYNKAVDLFNIDENGFHYFTVFKYKSIEINFKLI